MTQQKYQPGIYVVKYTDGIPQIAQCVKSDAWRCFAISHVCGQPTEILAGPFTVEQIAGIGEVIEAFGKVMQWVRAHPRKATIVSSVIQEADAALAKFGK